MDRTNVNLTNLETNRSQLKNAVTLQENALKFYMGMPIEEPIALVKEDVQINPQLLTDQINTDNRTEVKVLEKKKTAASVQCKSYTGRLLPYTFFSRKLCLAGVWT